MPRLYEYKEPDRPQQNDMEKIFSNYIGHKVTKELRKALEEEIEILINNYMSRGIIRKREFNVRIVEKQSGSFVAQVYTIDMRESSAQLSEDLNKYLTGNENKDVKE